MPVKKKGRQPISPPEDVLLTFREATSFLRVSRSTLYRLMWSGQLSGYKIGGLWRFYRKELYAYANKEKLSSAFQFSRMA
jgi:excisionase family DNA binding protein